AMGFKRSEKRMKAIEVHLRAGMARQGITGEAADAIVKSISSFALYGFPESHSASFALIVYASAYLKAHFPAAFYTALLNNQPMGFYHPASLVKDAQRHGVRFAPIDVQRSSWPCDIDDDGSVRLGLRYVNGLRRHVGEAMAQASSQSEGRVSLSRPLSLADSDSLQNALEGPKSAWGDEVGPRAAADSTLEMRFAGLASGTANVTHAPRLLQRGREDVPSRCPKCGCDDPRMIERVQTGAAVSWFCNTCSHDWKDEAPRVRFRSLEDFIARTGVNREELATLAEIGALNAFGHHRREALWQIEKAIRPAGELFEEGEGRGARGEISDGAFPLSPPSPRLSPDPCPLPPMTVTERRVADYAGTHLTIGPHPMALRRRDLSLRGVLRAMDLPRERHGRRIRVAGTVITRQRPGTAKGFVFLTLEDETGISNIIVRPDVFSRERLVILEEPFLLVEGILQNQENVTSVRAERVEGIDGVPIEIESHDFY
ncbi:MAG: hypothetical protein NTY02_12000, partial [Acidobacteria bacterium]|nr:hypothetical protein [Acidobacteriota bacterium]